MYPTKLFRRYVVIPFVCHDLLLHVRGLSQTILMVRSLLGLEYHDLLMPLLANMAAVSIRFKAMIGIYPKTRITDNVS
jgi:hypothetical protein